LGIARWGEFPGGMPERWNPIAREKGVKIHKVDPYRRKGGKECQRPATGRGSNLLHKGLGGGTTKVFFGCIGRRKTDSKPRRKTLSKHGGGDSEVLWAVNCIEREDPQTLSRGKEGRPIR